MKKELSTKGLNQLALDLGLPLTKQDPNEFKQEKNLLNMPLKSYIKMAKAKAIRIHVNNLFATYGEEEVLRILIEQAAACLK